METIQSCLIQYGYLGIFLVLALGIFGPPVADELVLLFLGFLVFKGHLQLGATGLAVIAGSLTGVSLDYALGRVLGHYVLHRPDSWLHRQYGHIYQVRQRLARSGGWAFACSYFVPGWRHCAPMVGGLSGLEFPRFAGLSFPGGVCWSLVYLCLGYWLGEKWSFVLPQTHQLLIIFGALVTLGLAYRFWRKRSAWA
jgi:membrane protein DedA with SNARE-associated domain